MFRTFKTGMPRKPRGLLPTIGVALRILQASDAIRDPDRGLIQARGEVLRGEMICAEIVCAEIVRAGLICEIWDKTKNPVMDGISFWLQGQDLNLRPPGYE